jgi:Skp family chaperone for outer membrane proteins
MTFKTFAVASSAMAIALAGATSAAAQQPAAPAAAAPQVSHGNAPPGVCVISPEGVVANSSVGKYVQTRLQQLVAQVNAELQGERTTLENDAKTLNSQRTTLDQNTLEQRAAALEVRDRAFQRKAQQRDQEMQATQSKALNRIYTEMEPLIRQAYQAKSCAMLVNRQVVVLANPSMDLTPQVVTALNSKITQFAFERERLDQAATAPRPAAPAAAAPAATPQRR